MALPEGGCFNAEARLPIFKVISGKDLLFYHRWCYA
jgi:hypothetical protein